MTALHSEGYGRGSKVVTSRGGNSGRDNQEASEQSIFVRVGHIAVAVYANIIGVAALVLGKKMHAADAVLAGTTSILTLSCIGRLFDGRPGEAALTLAVAAVLSTACTIAVAYRPFEASSTLANLTITA